MDVQWIHLFWTVEIKYFYNKFPNFKKLKLYRTYLAEASFHKNEYSINWVIILYDFCLGEYLYNLLYTFCGLLNFRFSSPSGFEPGVRTGYYTTRAQYICDVNCWKFFPDKTKPDAPNIRWNSREPTSAKPNFRPKTTKTETKLWRKDF